MGTTSSTKSAVTVRTTTVGGITTVSIIGGNGVDVINAATLFGTLTGNRYEIIAGNGADTVNGSWRNEIIWGDSSNNSDTSANGADTLNGGGGNDQIHGGNGADIISGDAGADTLYGDRGGDTFKYACVADSAAAGGGAWSASTGDWIKDFTAADGDKLDFRGFNGKLTGAGHPDMLTASSGPAAYSVWVQASGGSSFVYADTNGDGTADVAIKVTGNVCLSHILGLNHGPSAGNDSLTIAEDTSASATVAGNDSDPDGNTLSFALNAAAPTGLTFNSDGTYSFDAGAYDSLAAGDSQVLNIGYTVSDGHGGSAAATLQITITGTNDGPQVSAAIADTHSDEDEAVNFSIPAGSFTDIDGDELSYTATLAGGDILPEWLSFNSATQTFTGTPPANWNGTLSVTVTASDGEFSADDTFDLVIDAVNDAPALTGAAAALGGGTEDTDYIVSAADLLAGWTDVEGDPLSIENLGADHGTIADNGDGTYTVTLDGDYNGSVTLSYDVSDGTDSTGASLGFEVAAVNDAAALTGDPATLANGTEDTDYIVTAADLLAGWTDADGDTLVVGNLSADHGSVLENPDGSYTITLEENYNGPVVLSYEVADGTSSTPATIGFEVDAVNDTPDLTGSPASLSDGTEDTSYTVSAADLLAGWTDVDGDSLSVENLSADHGSVADNGDGTYTVTLDANYNGPVTLSYDVSDGTASTAASLGFDVAAVNDAPGQVVAGSLANGTEDTSYTVSAADLLAGWFDVEGDTLSVENLSADHGTIADNGDGTYTVTLDENYNGPVTLSYDVSDGTASTAASLGFEVDAVNDVPELSGTAATLGDGTEDTDYTVLVTDLLAGWTDVEGDTLTVENLSADHGTVADNGDGTYTVTLDENYNGPVTLSYDVSDGTASTAASLGFEVDAVNDVPELSGTAATLGDGTEDTDYTVLVTDLLAGWTDVEGDTLTVENLSADHGSVADNGDGTYTVTLDANYNGPVTLSYDVSDGTASTAASLGFEVDAVNDVPTGTTPALSGTEDTPVAITQAQLLTGWSDIDGDTLTITGLTANHGTITANPGGGWTFNPAANYNGGVTLSFSVGDGTTTVETTATLNLAAAADASSFGGQLSGSVTEDAAPNTVGGTATVSDPDGPASIVAQSGTGGSYGTFSITAGGVWSYALDNSNATVNALNDGSPALTDSFTITASDGTTSSVVVTINGDTDAPTYTSPTVYTGTGDPNDFDVNGTSGTQTITGGNGNDTLYGGTGNDNINGGGGDDTIYGGSGNDSLDGNNNGDTLYGGSGNDSVIGSNGDDRIIGGYGADTLSGSNGADTFVYLSNRDTGDTIVSFNQADDLIDLSALGLTGGFLGTVSGGGVIGAHQFGYAAVGLTTVIFVDTDGILGADLEITLNAVVTLTSGVGGDFVI